MATDQELWLLSLSLAEAKGSSACEEGFLLSDNPYNFNSDEARSCHKAWIRGWERMNKVLAARLRKRRLEEGKEGPCLCKRLEDKVQDLEIRLSTLERLLRTVGLEKTSPDTSQTS